MKRVTAATPNNTSSSRSHLLVRLEIVSGTESKQTKAQLDIVDLAGNEPASTSNNCALTGSINLSLAALGNVIQALHNRNPYVPYRDNDLTLLLPFSLGGKSKTMFFVNLSLQDHITQSNDSQSSQLAVDFYDNFRGD